MTTKNETETFPLDQTCQVPRPNISVSNLWLKFICELLMYELHRESMPHPHHSYKSHNAVQQPLCRWGLWHHQCYALCECFLSNLIMEYRQRLRLGFKLWTLVTDNNGDIIILMAEYNWFYGPDSDLCFSVWKQQQGAGEAAGKGKNNMSDKIFVIFDLFLKYYLSVLSVIQNTQLLCVSVWPICPQSFQGAIESL